MWDSDGTSHLPIYILPVKFSFTMLLSKHCPVMIIWAHLRYVGVYLVTTYAIMVSFHLIGSPGVESNLPFSSIIAAPLYSSFSREAVLHNINRKRIMKVIEANEGITFSAIKTKLGLQNGVLAYHLAMLEKNHYIKSFADGKFKRFYSRKAQISGLTSAEEQIMAVIRSNPYITKRRLAKLSEYSQGTININIKKLMQKQLIDLIKDGKRYKYYPRKIERPD